MQNKLIPSWEDLKLHGPRGARPRCGVITRKGKPCMGQALATGRCYLHSGYPRGVSPEGQARQAETARKTMKRNWATIWRDGRPLSPKGRAAISEGQKRRHAARRQQDYSADHQEVC